MRKNIVLLGLFGCLSLLHAAVSQTPPMGWNSYDAFNFSVTEAEFKASVDTMAKKYLQYGWNYAVVDWCWSFPGMGTQGTPNQGWNATGTTVTTRLNMDAYGRPMPDTVRHPSAKGGLGFKPLADYTHSKGLKFGIHLMRGVYRQAYWASTPVLGTTYNAHQIADTTKANQCTWLDHVYALNMNHPGAQAYLNSLMQLFASWGVDFIKVDDLINPYGTPNYHQAELEGYRKAIDSCGREMVFSTSPGATPVAQAAHIASHANQWRMANDLWDTWTSVNAMFALCASWYTSIGPGHFPDADMIPIGRLSKRGPNGSTRYSNLTRTEQYTVMTLWSIFRSPLLYGGNPAENRAAEDSLLTNADVIAINQNSSNNRPLATGNYPVWAANSPDTNVKYVALFNTTASTATVSVALSNFGPGSWSIRNVWTQTDIGTLSGTLSATVPSHGSVLFKLTVPGTPILFHASKSQSGKLKGDRYEVRGRHVNSLNKTGANRVPEEIYIQRDEKGN